MAQLITKFYHMSMFQWAPSSLHPEGKLEIKGTVTVNGGSYEMTEVILPPEITSAIDQFMCQEATRRLGGEHA